MIAIVLAAAAGLSYGTADFLGAFASKRTSAMLVTVAMQAVSLIALNAWLLAFPSYERHPADLVWGAVGGLGAAVALVCFYQALAIGPMSTAAAITGIIGTVIPVGAGLAMGDRPGMLTLAGVVLCVPAATLVAAGVPGLGNALRLAPPRERAIVHHRTGQTRRLAVAAGIGFGVFFVSLSRVSGEAGLFPLVGARAASIIGLGALITLRHEWSPLERGAWKPVVAAGVFDCAANAFYLLALTNGDLSWVAAITSLYPVATVMLARVVLGERLGRVQVIGLGLAGVALALVTGGA